MRRSHHNTPSPYISSVEWDPIYRRLIGRDPSAIAQARQYIAQGKLGPDALNQANSILRLIAAAPAPVAPPAPAPKPSVSSPVAPSPYFAPLSGQEAAPFLNAPSHETGRTRGAQRNEARAAHRRSRNTALMNSYLDLHRPGNPNPYSVGGGRFYTRGWHAIPGMSHRNYGHILSDTAQLALDDEEALLRQMGNNNSPDLMEGVRRSNPHVNYSRPIPSSEEMVAKGYIPPPAAFLTPENQRARRLEVYNRAIHSNNDVGKLINNIIIDDVYGEILGNKVDYREQLQELLKNPFLNPSQKSTGHMMLNTRFPPFVFQEEKLYPRSSGDKKGFSGFSGRKQQDIPEIHIPLQQEKTMSPYPDWGPKPLEDYKSHLSKKSKIDRLFEARNKNKWNLKRGGYVPPYWN